MHGHLNVKLNLHSLISVRGVHSYRFTYRPYKKEKYEALKDEDAVLGGMVAICELYNEYYTRDVPLHLSLHTYNLPLTVSKVATYLYGMDDWSSLPCGVRNFVFLSKSRKVLLGRPIVSTTNYP